MISIDELERLLSNPDADLSVEIKPNGEIHAYIKDEPREHGPVRIFTAKEAIASSY